MRDLPYDVSQQFFLGDDDFTVGATLCKGSESPDPLGELPDNRTDGPHAQLWFVSGMAHMSLCVLNSKDLHRLAAFLTDAADDLESIEAENRLSS